MDSENDTFTWLPLVNLVLRLAWGCQCSGVPLPLAPLLLPHQSLVSAFLHTPLSFPSSLSSPPPLHKGAPCFSPIWVSVVPKSYSLTRHGSDPRTNHCHVLHKSQTWRVTCSGLCTDHSWTRCCWGRKLWRRFFLMNVLLAHVL